jgi:transcriptional antiterminator NusG
LNVGTSLNPDLKFMNSPEHDEELTGETQQPASEVTPGDSEATMETSTLENSESASAPISEDATAPAATAGIVSALEEDSPEADEDDDSPAELEDPFSGGEDAQPVAVGDDDDDDQPSVADMDWYILKVQSNREDSIRETLLRRISMQGMDRMFGEVIVPKEQVTDFKGGKKRVVWRKLYPGYILVQMVLNDETWYLVRETGGIGDFTGSAGRPSPMLPQDVAKLLHKTEEKADEAPKLKINFKKGDRVKINEGTFENFEGEVEQIDEANGRVTVMLSIFGRSTPVDIEYWQIENV